MQICEEEFFRALYSIVKVSMPAKALVQQAWDERTKFHPSGEYIWFEQSAPWKAHLLDIEKEQNQRGLIKFAFFHDARKMVRIAALPLEDSTFG